MEPAERDLIEEDELEGYLVRDLVELEDLREESFLTCPEVDDLLLFTEEL